MRISKANPIEWVLVDDLSFNQSKFSGVVQKCFFQKWNATDEIRTQFYNVDSVEAYDLLVRSVETNAIINAVPFERPDDTEDIWENAFQPDYDEQLIYLQIVNHADVSIVYAYCDPLDIQEDHPETELMRYSNALDYAGLDYTNRTVFSLRVWAKFFQEQRPTETESEPITNGNVVELSSSIKAQRYFEVEPAPFYLHDKITLAMKHNTCEIGGDLWKNEGTYETKQVDERHPFYTGKAWLTKQEGEYITNVYGPTTAIEI